QQSVEQMLRAQVLNRLVAGTLQGNRTDKKFVFRGNVHAKAFIVAGHVKDRLTNDWSLANHADLRGTLGKKKSLYLVVLLDDAAVFRAGRGLEFDSGIDALHRAGKFVVFFEQFFAIGITYDRLTLRRQGSSGFDVAATAARKGRQCRPDHPSLHTYFPSRRSHRHK